MDRTTLTAHFEKEEGIKETITILQNQIAHVYWKGVVGSAHAFMAVALANRLDCSHVFVLKDKETAAYFQNDLDGILNGEKPVYFYPASERAPYQLEETDNANIVARTEVLDHIRKNDNIILVTYPEALAEKIPTKQTLTEQTLKVETGKTYSISFLTELMHSLDFQPVDFVYEPGQFAVRGGILDVFSFNADLPFRIEFFDDEVESIRSFDPVSQLSERNHAFFNLVPNIQKTVHQAKNIDVLNYLGDNKVLWMDDLDLTIQKLNKFYEKAVEIHTAKEDHATRPPIPSELFLHPSEFQTLWKGSKTIEFGDFCSDSVTHKFAFAFQPQPSFNKNFDILSADLKERSKLGMQNLIFSNQAKQIERLYSIFEDIDADVTFIPMHFALREGFILTSQKLVCYTDHQIFERYHRFRLKEGFRQTKQALTLKEIYNLQKGDFVTHIDHGVGRFSGLETIDVNGKPQEAIRLIYKDNDVLYVSIHSLHRISKFTGKDGTAPTMNKLGTKAWSNLKKKTKAKIKELAFDLIQLYAKRRAQPGFSFSPDSYLQNELEASFIYEDTPDQLKATEAVKQDMEKNTPMDRLICGDVGFGKTEVAIRAAFKAATDGKQVAVLVPTTILSMQHYRSFKERLKDFPVNVDYINRFKSAKSTSETLKKLKEGKIDILIGTHKIVGAQVKFKDLGLIIIDEEQKFGVGVKDKLKTLKATVDTLTLTATPIPRTLQFSLLGARDLSVISTPPPNRQPVLTEIIEFNEEKVRDAIAYEVSRGGQVYFVHNRLENIKEVSGMISRLCPGVRVGIGHGQMDGKQLEKVMLDFIDHEYDVLLATTIIESGIDISNANTILINNAQNFGLSDLHQLRGRVGRSNKKGFCYLIAPRMNMLTSEARKRLNALVQFSDLGSGFNIAMKDLDIRGAGNLLGGEQTGFIADIGFEMYQKILNEAISELRNNEFKELFEDNKSDQLLNFVEDCVLETDIEIRIPDTYVNNVAERLSIYQEMDNFTKEEELSKLSEELRDRFGPIPDVVFDLMDSMRLRWLAQEIGFEKLIIKSEKMVGYFISDPQHSYYQS
ncbi:MAG: transcription-repair coupling factor, partial [Crocinitomicaceae bacterium]|nr:transcription-repair coupling factor [Crocinitomicaceae bacterium]